MWHRIRAEKLLAFEKADQGGPRAGIRPKGRYEGFDEVIEGMPGYFGDFQT